MTDAAALAALRTERDACIEEIAKWSPYNENVKRGYLVAALRDVVQVMITARDNSKECLRQLEATEVERDALQRDSDILRKCNIVEIAVHNDTGSVSDYMKHWEGRTLKAEAERDALQQQLERAVARADLSDDEYRAVAVESARLRVALQHMQAEVVLTYGWENPRLKPLYDEAEAMLAGDVDKMTLDSEKLIQAQQEIARLRAALQQLPRYRWVNGPPYWERAADGDMVRVDELFAGDAAVRPPLEFCPSCGASIPHRVGEGRCEKCANIADARPEKEKK